MRSDERALLRLTTAIYDAALDPSAWPAFLEAVCNEIGGHSACLIFHDPSTPKGTVESAFRLDPAAALGYAHYFGALDPWAERLKARRELRSGLVCTGDEVLDHGLLRKTEYYNDYANRFGLTENVFALHVDPVVRTVFVVTVLRSDRAGPFDTEAVKLVSALRPHLTRAFQVHARLTEADSRARRSEAALDRLSTGVVLVNALGRVTFANCTARERCAVRDGIYIERGELLASGRTASARLQAALGRALHSTSAVPDAGELLQVARPSGRRPFSVLVSALPRPGRAVGDVAAIVLIVDPDRDLLMRTEILSRAYDLTPAEVGICEQLGAGRSISEAAARLSITDATARTHLKRILDKTGTHRQAELIRLLVLSHSF